MQQTSPIGPFVLPSRYVLLGPMFITLPRGQSDMSQSCATMFRHIACLERLQYQPTSRPPTLVFLMTTSSFIRAVRSTFLALLFSSSY